MTRDGQGTHSPCANLTLESSRVGLPTRGPDRNSRTKRFPPCAVFPLAKWYTIL